MVNVNDLQLFLMYYYSTYMYMYIDEVTCLSSFISMTRRLTFQLFHYCFLYSTPAFFGAGYSNTQIVPTLKRVGKKEGINSITVINKEDIDYHNTLTLTYCTMYIQAFLLDTYTSVNLLNLYGL